MSSAKRSRDPPNPGNEPTEELGYPALVQYTFVPNDTESSEILVSAGDIVHLVYKVGGWVFVRTYDGKVGYIPFSFCKELESSKEVGSTYSETGITKSSFVDKGGLFYSSDNQSSKHLFPFYTENLKPRHPSANPEEKRNFGKQGQQQLVTKTEKRVHFADQPKRRNACDICRNFLTSFNSIDHNTTNTGQKKENLKPHKLLKLLQTISKEGLVNIGNTNPTYNAQSFYGQIKDNRVNRRVNSSEFPIKFGNSCNQCDVLKDIFKTANRYSMSDLYSTIRNLHLHAITDSDSEEDEGSEIISESENIQMQNDAHVTFASENMPKRSISFKEQDTKQKVEIIRHNSFSGITDVERNELENGTISPTEISKHGEISKASVTSVACTRAAKVAHTNNYVDITNKNVVLQNHKINNYFPENQHSHATPHLTNGYDEDITEFRAADYQPPLISKWRPAKESASPEATLQRPPGIVREQTFEYESMKGRKKEVNFNDPKKENLNFSKPEKDKSPYVNIQNQVRHFTMDSRRKPLVSNGNFSLDDNDEFASSTQTLSSGYNSGTITKCFTTYGQSTRLQDDDSPGKSMTLDRHFKHSSQYSNHKKSDNFEKKPNLENTYRDHDNHFSKQTETDSAIDRRKIVARKVNPVTSPRSLKSTIGSLMGRKNDKDIRKSLLENSAMKRTMGNPSESMRTQPMRAQPMRAQHDIATPNDAALTAGRTVLVKKFNKQMWRPSLAGSEGSDQRPFSPFGGTLPPSKIVKKKVVEVFV